MAAIGPPWPPSPATGPLRRPGHGPSATAPGPRFSQVTGPGGAQVLAPARYEDEVLEPLTRYDESRTWHGRFEPMPDWFVGRWLLEFFREGERTGILKDLEALPWTRPECVRASVTRGCPSRPRRPYGRPPPGPVAGSRGAGEPAGPGGPPTPARPGPGSASAQSRAPGPTCGGGGVPGPLCRAVRRPGDSSAGAPARGFRAPAARSGDGQRRPRPPAGPVPGDGERAPRPPAGPIGPTDQGFPGTRRGPVGAMPKSVPQPRPAGQRPRASPPPSPPIGTTDDVLSRPRRGRAGRSARGVPRTRRGGGGQGGGRVRQRGR